MWYGNMVTYPFMFKENLSNEFPTLNFGLEDIVIKSSDIIRFLCFVK